MSESTSPVARVGFFVSFVALLVVGYYAYTLRAQVAAAHAAATMTASQEQSLQTKLAASEKAAQASADSAKSCEQRATDLKTKLDEANAAAQTPAKHKR